MPAELALADGRFDAEVRGPGQDVVAPQHSPHGRLVHLNIKELLRQQSCAINDKEPACVSKESHQLKCKICTPNGGIWVAPLSFSMKVVYYSDTILKPFKTLITL